MMLIQSLRKWVNLKQKKTKIYSQTFHWTLTWHYPIQYFQKWIPLRHYLLVRCIAKRITNHILISLLNWSLLIQGKVWNLGVRRSRRPLDEHFRRLNFSKRFQIWTIRFECLLRGKIFQVAIYRNWPLFLSRLKGKWILAGIGLRIRSLYGSICISH